MNIFYLAQEQRKAAELHCDKHVVKMILEYVQMLSTAHRILDGTLTTKTSIKGRTRKHYALADAREDLLVSHTHENHPCAVWVRESTSNYKWLYGLFIACLEEYTYRYGKTHSYQRLVDALGRCPNNMKLGAFTQPPQCMPDDSKIENDTVSAYRLYYVKHKAHFCKWRNRQVPEWFQPEQQETLKYAV